MKLHKTKAYSRGGKDYHVWKVNLPEEHVKAMGWDHGQHLEAVPQKRGLLLRPASRGESEE